MLGGGGGFRQLADLRDKLDDLLESAKEDTTDDNWSPSPQSAISLAGMEDECDCICRSPNPLLNAICFLMVSAPFSGSPSRIPPSGRSTIPMAMAEL